MARKKVMMTVDTYEKDGKEKKVSRELASLITNQQGNESLCFNAYMIHALAARATAAIARGENIVWCSIFEDTPYQGNQQQAGGQQQQQQEQRPVTEGSGSASIPF